MRRFLWLKKCGAGGFEKSLVVKICVFVFFLCGRCCSILEDRQMQGGELVGFDLVLASCLALSILSLLGEEDLVNVGKDTTLGDGDLMKQLVELLVVANGKLKVAWDDAGLLVVTSSVSSQLEDLSGQVLEHGGEVDGGTSTDTLGVVALAEETVDTTHGELKSGLLGAGLAGLVRAGLASRRALEELLRLSLGLHHGPGLLGSRSLISGGSRAHCGLVC